MLKRSPALAIVIAVFITVALISLIENPSRPITPLQGILFYLAALPPSFGIALLFDPFSKQKKDEYLKINFYEEK